jgi:hypothetical protein
MEKWKKIPDSNYSVSTHARIRNNLTNYMFKLHVNKQGYQKIHIKVGVVEKNFFVHRLLMAAFVPNPENKPCVNHINGIKNDNRLENLEWCTVRENNIHAFRCLGKSAEGNYSNLKNIPPPVPVYSIDSLGNKVRFNSLKEAGISIGTTAGHVYNSVYKKKKNGSPYTAKGYCFELA